MRIRSIKPEFWRSEDITGLRLEDRLLFIGLWSYVDDNGVGRDHIPSIIGDVFARDMFENPRETVARVSEGLQHLSEAGRIVRYTVANRTFLAIRNWEKHQKIDHPAKPRYPTPDQAEQSDSRDSRETLANPREDLAPGTGEQGNRGTGEQTSTSDEVEEARSKRAPRRRATRIPDEFIVTTDLRTWAATTTPTVDLNRATEKFVNYWRAKSGKDATKLDWAATWRNWMLNEADRTQPRHGRESSLDRLARQQQETFADLEAAFDFDQKAIGQ